MKTHSNDFAGRPSACAFTLVEMILAIGIAAIVLVAINAVFFSALHLREVTQAAVDEATPVTQALPSCAATCNVRSHRSPMAS